MWLLRAGSSLLFSLPLLLPELLAPLLDLRVASLVLDFELEAHEHFSVEHVHETLSNLLCHLPHALRSATQEEELQYERKCATRSDVKKSIAYP